MMYSAKLRRHVAPLFVCSKTVPKPLALTRLGLALSEKQFPQIVENVRSRAQERDALERRVVLRRQMLYPPELRAREQSTEFSIFVEKPVFVDGDIALDPDIS